LLKNVTVRYDLAIQKWQQRSDLFLEAIRDWQDGKDLPPIGAFRLSEAPPAR